MAQVSWGQGLDNKTTFNAKQFADNMAKSRDAQRNDLSRSLITPSKTGVIGINANQIPNMRRAIENYIERIKKHLDGINPDADANKAYKGDEVQKAVRAYVANVKKYCNNLVSQLKAFNDKLKDIENTYNKNKEQLAKNINNNAEKAGIGKEYQYQK